MNAATTDDKDKVADARGGTEAGEAPKGAEISKAAEIPVLD
jgi:hypothetical protein